MADTCEVRNQMVDHGSGRQWAFERFAGAGLGASPGLEASPGLGAPAHPEEDRELELVRGLGLLPSAAAITIEGDSTATTSL